MEHKLWARLKRDGLVEKRFLLACSGGRDSVALVCAFARIRPAANLVVSYIHHGEGGSPGYRDRAEGFVRDLATKLGLRFETARWAGAKLGSEAEWRKARRALLRDLQKSTACDWIVTAHHAQDLLETRLIAFLRGSGSEGLRALRVRRAPWYRPLLDRDAGEIRAYLGEIGQDWVEDPSNVDPRHLRNWLRHEWLPALESYRAGSIRALERSFQNCVDEFQSLIPDVVSVGNSLSRVEWETLSQDERRRKLAGYLRSRGHRHFTRGQIEEVCRQLDRTRKQHTFVVAGCFWQVNAEQITAQPADKVL